MVGVTVLVAGSVYCCVLRRLNCVPNLSRPICLRWLIGAIGADGNLVTIDVVILATYQYYVVYIYKKAADKLIYWLDYSSSRTNFVDKGSRDTSGISMMPSYANLGALRILATPA